MGNGDRLNNNASERREHHKGGLPVALDAEEEVEPAGVQDKLTDVDYPGSLRPGPPRRHTLARPSLEHLQ